jgi:Holliday junction resolvase
MGGAGSREVGALAERALVELLKGWGFEVYWDPKSLVDVVARKSGRTLVFEVKLLRVPGIVDVREAEIGRATELAEKLGGEAVLAMYIVSLREWRALPMNLVARLPVSVGRSGRRSDRYVTVPASHVFAAPRLENYLRARGLL